MNVVVAAPEGHTLRQPTYTKAVDALVADLRDLPQVADGEPIANPVDAADSQRQQMLKSARQSGTPASTAKANAAALSPLSSDGSVGIISFEYDVETVADVEPSTHEALLGAMDHARDGGLTVEANGSGTDVETEAQGSSELIGIAVALAVLLLTFGSLVAAGLPILTATFGVGLGITGVTAMTAFTDIGSSTPVLASMIGLAVGIDYALFILARYRTELHNTDDREEAIGIAVGTAGSAVVFAGLTVIIALAALAVVRIPFLTAIGLAAAGTVLIAVLVALTLLPAILGMLKSKAFGGQVRRYAPRRDTDGHVINNGVRWARLVGRRPVAVALLAVVALGALAVPTQGPPPRVPVRQHGVDRHHAAQGVGPDGRGVRPGPRGSAGGRRRRDRRGRGRPVRRDRQGHRVGSGPERRGQRPGRRLNEKGTGAQILVTPSSAPDDPATEDLLADLRGGQAGIEAETGTTTGVTGLTAITTDVSDRLADALPIYLTVVIGLAFILLMIVFRSVLVPLTATLGFLLSVLATLGVTVAVFQEGAFGIMEGQPIVSHMPIILIGVVFGLAMDYQVFLVTRIREAHVHGYPMREAVVDGFRNSARVVTAAATIMTAVFAAFMLQDDPIVKSMGFALAVAVVFDAFVVRMALIPALLYLMDEKAWWLPRWLDRLLPNVDVEGEKLERPQLQGRSIEDELADLTEDSLAR